jgi:hypothetical protein
VSERCACTKGSKIVWPGRGDAYSGVTHANDDLIFAKRLRLDHDRTGLGREFDRRRTGGLSTILLQAVEVGSHRERRLHGT